MMLSPSRAVHALRRIQGFITHMLLCGPGAVPLPSCCCVCAPCVCVPPGLGGRERAGDGEAGAEVKPPQGEGLGGYHRGRGGAGIDSRGQYTSPPRGCSAVLILPVNPLIHICAH